MNQSRSDEPTPEKSWNLQTQEIRFDLTDVREIAALYILQHCQPGESLSGHLRIFWSQIPMIFKTYEFGSMRKHVAKVFKEKKSGLRGWNETGIKKPLALLSAIFM